MVDIPLDDLEIESPGDLVHIRLEQFEFHEVVGLKADIEGWQRGVNAGILELRLVDVAGVHFARLIAKRGELARANSKQRSSQAGVHR
ncbi:hypothetical protein L596_018746 [Steinernema carpocapsae]|uniref:Uncharacterized protein n=1 Tax=Steinernema carpocapsae TaxID=34508 RepID=A0A4U5N622_STECR|nr:hypothetical protein L596_018746 [Steinernema carpocapsae]